ncbi:hypothetical protein ACOBV8_19595 (plasmid) [Pseudoalteromonas espejiana]
MQQAPGTASVLQQTTPAIKLNDSALKTDKNVTTLTHPLVFTKCI